jgi:hypothetical protein
MDNPYQIQYNWDHFTVATLILSTNSYPETEIIVTRKTQLQGINVRSVPKFYCEMR